MHALTPGPVRAAMIALLKNRGCPVRLDESPYGYELRPSYYGWRDWDAEDHGRTCEWIIPDDTALHERIYDTFGDTNHGTVTEHGVDVDGISCTCGKYSNVRLRYDGSMGQILRDLLKYDGR